MKKFLALVLALVMVTGMAVTAMAAVEVSNGSQDVKASYQADQTATVYSVDITWGSMEFTYSEGNKGTWNSDSLSYDEANKKDPGWSCATGANVITIKNKSNAAVTPTAEFTKNAQLATELSAVEVTVSNSGTAIASAESGTAQTGTLTVQVSGTVTGAFDANTVLGSITITIN